MIFIDTLIFLAVAGTMYALLMKGTVPAPTVMSKEELQLEGLSPQQIRIELRRQRQEARQHTYAKAAATRASNQIAKSVVRSIKQSRKSK